jgi:hypothetical protein
MKTLLGLSQSRLTPEELQALIRRAHAERAQVLRQMLAALFRRPEAAKAEPDDGHASLRPAA